MIGRYGRLTRWTSGNLILIRIKSVVSRSSSFQLLNQVGESFCNRWKAGLRFDEVRSGATLASWLLTPIFVPVDMFPGG